MEYTVKEIYDDDFGCEENDEIKVVFVLEDFLHNTTTVSQPDDKNINIGDRVIIDENKRIKKIK